MVDRPIITSGIPDPDMFLDWKEWARAYTQVQESGLLGALKILDEADWEAGARFEEALVSPAKLAAAVAALGGGGGGLVLEDTDTADGTAEHLQVTATSTPSSIKRMEAGFRSMVPEIDGDTVFLTVILDDDSELTTATAYNHLFWEQIDAAFTEGRVSVTIPDIVTLGNASTIESVSSHIVLMSENGSNVGKQFLEFITQRTSTPTFRMVCRSHYISTTQSIKGFRYDTNNAGDMLNSGVGRIWVQT